MIYASYHPKADITAYELAVLLPGLVRSPTVFNSGFLAFTTAEWNAMGQAQRHFERSYPDDVENESDHPLLRALGGTPG